MSNTVSVSIPAPCSEDWNKFTPTANGKFCGCCQQNVIDFTATSDVDILEFFSNNSKHVCGRFRQEQLKNYTHQAPAMISPGFTFLRAGILSLLLLFISKQTYAQGRPMVKITHVAPHCNSKVQIGAVEKPRIIKGVVMADNDLPLPGVNIQLKGSDEGTYSSADGGFRFPRALKPGDVLLFMLVGLESREYIVPAKAEDDLEIFMHPNTYVLGKTALKTKRKFSVKALWRRITRLKRG